MLYIRNFVFMKEYNRKKHQVRGDCCDIRVFHKKQKGKISPRYLLKCGCCDESLEIYYSKDDLEINGILGTIDNWREILLPLLEKKEQLCLEKRKI